MRSDRRIIDLLLEAGANVNAANDSGSTALMEAVQSGDPEITKILLDKGADLSAKEHYYGSTALHIAAQVGHGVDVVRVLIEKGADVNTKDKNGNTPLMIAVGSFQTTKLLLEHGADVNARDKDDWTALESALVRGCPEVIQLLEKAGARE